MGTFIQIWIEIQPFYRWLVLQYSVEPAMYPYSCIL